MRILRSFEYDHCTIEQVSYKGDLYMPPHVDDESKIGIVLDGSLIERSTNGSVEATRNSVVIKPNFCNRSIPASNCSGLGVCSDRIAYFLSKVAIC